ncbi:response regulator transcription factor [Streptomyces sp. NBC_00536]|nr:response regulator transcription factor [Streptomyces sp. NBC_00536]WUC77081.1 response regulator transcription factor [Streptomyces sp. NBC_00536]
MSWATRRAETRRYEDACATPWTSSCSTSTCPRPTDWPSPPSSPRCRAPPRVLILTNLGSDQNLLQALDAGASGFVLKTAGPDCIISAVRLTAAGGCATMPDLVKGLLGAARLQSPRRARTARARLDVLSDRQREILALVARGDSNARIGRKLGMTEGTVKTYLSRILTLIHAENRTQAALLMYDAGFTDEVGS